MSKTFDEKLDEILRPVVDGLREWIDGELAGTEYHNKAIESHESNVLQAKQAIKQLIKDVLVGENE